MTTVKICIPFYWDFETAKSGLRELKAGGKKVSQWVYDYQGYRWVIEPRRGCFPKGEVSNSLVFGDKTITHLAQFRNSFIKKDVDGFDYFLFIDSDIQWSIVDALRLLGHDKDIVGGAYSGHVNSKTYQAGKWKQVGIIDELLSTANNGLLKVDFIGAGMLLCKNKIFKPTEYPWFHHAKIEINGHTEEIGEDYSFCLGREVWCDCGLELKHRDLPEPDWNF